MKKSYQKPQIMFEDFSVSTNIASGCEHIASAAPDLCPVTLPWGSTTKVVFINESMGCKTTPAEKDSDQYNGVCYHVPYESNNVFTS